MSATYTFDIFCTLDGFGSYSDEGDWGGYWGKQGPEFLARREEVFAADQRIVFGATTYREFVAMYEGQAADGWVARLQSLPLFVVSSTLQDPLEWPNAHVVSGVDAVARLKDESDVPLRSHGSLSLNHALMAAGLVDRLQVTIFPAISGKTGTEPIFGGAGDFDLELLEQRTFDGHTQELTYRPTLH
jgi:dihydrofolate reductase